MGSGFQIDIMDLKDRLIAAFDAPFAGAVLFGVHVDWHIVVEVLLVAVIGFLLFQKSYQPEKRPLTVQEIDQLCEEWVPEPLHATISKEMEFEPPVLERVQSLCGLLQDLMTITTICSELRNQ